MTSKTIIDLFITRKSNTSSVTSISVLPPFASDHCTISVHVNRPRRVAAIRKQQWMYQQGDYDGLNNAIVNSDWSFIDQTSSSVDEIGRRFMDTLNQLFQRFIPVKQFILRPRDKPWMNPQIRRAMRKRNRCHHKAKIVNSMNAWNRFKTQRNLVNSLIRQAKRQSTQATFDTLNSSSHSRSDWWKLVKSCFGSSDSIIPALRTTDTHGRISYANNDVDKANVLNDYFVTVTHKDDENH